jgi:hypothetical protein
MLVLHVAPGDAPQLAISVRCQALQRAPIAPSPGAKKLSSLRSFVGHTVRLERIIPSGNRGASDRFIYARDKYVPSAVSTRIFSPSLMNGGT